MQSVAYMVEEMGIMSETVQDVWEIVRFGRRQAAFELGSEDGLTALIFGMSIEADGRTLSLQDASEMTGDVDLKPGQSGEVSFDFAEPAISCRAQVSLSNDAETVLLSAEITNKGANVVALGRCCLVNAATAHDGLIALDDDGSAVFLQASASTALSRVYAVSDPEADKRSNVFLHIVSNSTGKALHLGFVTLDRMGTYHEFDYDPDSGPGEIGGGFTELHAVCDLYDYPLAPGASMELETLMIESRADLHGSLHNWADRVADHYKPAIWPKIPGGWLGWAWVDCFNVELYEDVIIRNAEAVRRRLGGFDIEYIWESLGNLPGGCPGAWLGWNETCFPRGHQWLVDRLAELDFKLGLWVGPFYVADSMKEFVEEMDDALLKKDGELALASRAWRFGEAGQLPYEQRPNMYALDPTHPQGEEFLRHVFSTYRDWGIRYYMLDFLGAVSRTEHYNQHHDPAIVRGIPIMRKGLEIIAEAAQPDTYTLSSSGPTFTCVGDIVAARMGNDYGEGRPLDAETYHYPGTFLINKSGAVTSHFHASTNMAAAYFTHRKLFINDTGNVMTVDQPLPLSDAQIVTTIFGINGGPVMLGDDIDRISEERLALIKKVFPRHPQIAEPVDLFDSPAPDYPKVFHVRIEGGWDTWHVVAVLNYGDQTLTEDIPLERLGMSRDDEYLLWEFWDQRYHGKVSGELQAVVPPGSARIYRLTARREHPWVLSTDMHVLQGNFELAEVTWDPQTMTLSGTANRPNGEAGSLFVSVPEGLYVVNPQGLWIGKDDNDKTLVIRRAFTFGDEPEGWEIQFAPIVTDDRSEYGLR
jgi:hypothetical protein